jgi:hypothetical protein
MEGQHKKDKAQKKSRLVPTVVAYGVEDILTISCSGSSETQE